MHETETYLRERLAASDAINAQLLAACRRSLPWCEHVAATAQPVSADMANEAAKACRAAIEDAQSREKS